MSSTVMPTRVALERPRVSMVTGVAAGTAAHLRWNVTLVRTLFVLANLFAGAGVLFYLWLWAFMPAASEPQDVTRTRSAPIAWISLGLAASALVIAFLFEMNNVSNGYPEASAFIGWAVWSVVAQVLCVFAGLWAGFIDAPDTARGPRHALAIRVTATVILIVIIVLCALDFLLLQSQAGAFAFFIALVSLVALAAVYAPMVVTSLRDGTRERIRRIREEQRSEMAAHLHDSVLQTLALIQNRAGASSEAARLARAQERELRSWLYDGDELADSDLPTDLRDYAAALELDYAVVIDVVAAGASTERASGEVAAAAREAILNAARHAPGPISVYIEGSERAVDVFVRDRGSGFDLEAIPSDRLGVRQSIIGRMKRAGGDARVTRRENGTEVHLTLDYARATATATQRLQEMS